MGNAYGYRNVYQDSLAKEFGGILLPSHKPITIQGLCLWVDAINGRIIEDSSGRIGTLEDGSFFDNHMKQFTPSLRPALLENAINGRPAIHFADGDQIEATSLRNANFPQSGTMFIAGDIAYDEQTIPTPLFDNYGTTRNHIFIRPYNQIGVQVAFQKAGDGPYAWVSGPLLSDRKVILCLMWDTVNNIGTLYVNGALYQSSPIAEQPWQPDQQVVEFWSLLSDGFKLGEAMMYNRVLPSSAIQQLHHYLSTKWAIPISE